MGWFGYGLYNGDETQTCHLKFLCKAIPSLSEDEAFDCMKLNKTLIPKNLLSDFKKGIPLIFKGIKTPNLMRWDEYDAIEWQMLLSLFIDNDIAVPHKVLVYGLLACHYLLGEHSSDFNEPNKRRAAIRRFMKKVDENFCTIKARKEVFKNIKYVVK